MTPSIKVPEKSIFSTHQRFSLCPEIVCGHDSTQDPAGGAYLAGGRRPAALSQVPHPHCQPSASVAEVLTDGTGKQQVMRFYRASA